MCAPRVERLRRRDRHTRERIWTIVFEGMVCRGTLGDDYETPLTFAERQEKLKWVRLKNDEQEQTNRTHQLALVAVELRQRAASQDCVAMSLESPGLVVLAKCAEFMDRGDTLEPTHTSPAFEAKNLNCRVKVWWADDRCWFKGTIVSVNVNKGAKVHYDDGDTFWEDDVVLLRVTQKRVTAEARILTKGRHTAKRLSKKPLHLGFGDSWGTSQARTWSS